MTTIQAFILAIIDGVTEYLPISSTGHMIFASSYFGIQNDDFVKLFQDYFDSAVRWDIFARRFNLQNASILQKNISE